MFFPDTDFAPPSKTRRISSSGSDGLEHSPIRDKVTKVGDFVVVYVAVDFKARKGGRNSAGISVYWGDTHSCNVSLPLRGDKLTTFRAQLIGKCLKYKDRFCDLQADMGEGLSFYNVCFPPSLCFPALKMLLKKAKLMNLPKLMIHANLPYVRKNIDKIPMWIEKNWCHGGGKGKGKAMPNREQWQKINNYIREIQINWVWEPNGQTYKSIMEKASSMALLSEER